MKNLELIINQLSGMTSEADIKAYLSELKSNCIITNEDEETILSKLNLNLTNTSSNNFSTTVKRYSTEELKSIILDLFYEELATSTKMYFTNKFVEQGVIRPRFRYNQRQTKIKDIRARIEDHKALRQQSNEEGKKVYSESIALLTDLLNLETNFNITTQKQFYEKYNDVYTSHSFTEFPLNKKINGYYDDFNAVLVYYDNVTTPEIIEQLESNKLTLEEKKEIVKNNVEVTHVSLGLSDSVRASIAICGKFDSTYSDITNTNATTLPAKFSDFNKVTLADCEEIKNNDLAQIVQERIDMDKEKLQLLSEMTIKGETYKVFKSPGTSKEYIRYVCPSTQRVYYNVLNHDFLKNDEYGYYEKGNVDSYIKAWYSITNLGIELTDEEIAKPSISC